MENGVMITLSGVEKSDYEDYLEKIKKDFTQDVYEIDSEDYCAFSGTNGDGISVALTFGGDAMSIGVSKTAQ